MRFLRRPIGVADLSISIDDKDGADLLVFETRFFVLGDPGDFIGDFSFLEPLEGVSPKERLCNDRRSTAALEIRSDSSNCLRRGVGTRFKGENSIFSENALDASLVLSTRCFLRTGVLG